MKQKVLVVGDVHGQYEDLSALISNKKPDIVLQCGDLDIPILNYETDRIKMPSGCKMYFAPGNHENYSTLENLENLTPLAIESNAPIHIGNKVYFCPRGTRITLDDGRTVLFMGGGLSLDKQWRTPGYDWFHQEEITHKDLERLDGSAKVDIVISHTIPEEFMFQARKWQKYFLAEKIAPESSRQALDWVLGLYKPTLWYAGHFHVYMHGQVDNTRWYALSMSGRTKWWKWLKEKGKLNV